MAVCYQFILSKCRILFIDRSISAKAGQYLDILTRLFGEVTNRVASIYSSCNNCFYKIHLPKASESRDNYNPGRCWPLSRPFIRPTVSLLLTFETIYCPIYQSMVKLESRQTFIMQIWPSFDLTVWGTKINIVRYTLSYQG